MKLLRDLLVVALVAYGAFWWGHRPVPLRAPAVPGAMPELAMPSPSARPRSAEPASSMLVVPGDAVGPAPLHGKHRGEKPLGEKPRLLGESAVDITGGRVREPLPNERSPWSDRLSQPWAMGAVVALFIVLYSLLTRALRKGPGGHGFTHD